jgi:3-phenylpropionate/cinnamic acid dioxygenase small subunit
MTALDAPDRPTPVLRHSLEDRFEIEEFLFREARLADESRYAEWEDLVDDDMVYWVPRGEGDYDMGKQMSIIADNRSRLHTRIAQLKTGERHAQLPVSLIRRVIGNIEIEKTGETEFRVFSNFIAHELRRASNNQMVTWPARVEHRLRRKNGGFKMFFKKVMIVYGDEAVGSLGFII